MSGTVVFVTDFGLADGYAAELWGAAAAVAPAVRCIDGTHLIPPFDVLTAAYVCKRLGRTFGRGTALCAVVDPGVGGARAAVAVECDGVVAVAPDTGLVSYLWTEATEHRAVRVPLPPAASATFHGRDVFAPLAARLAAGDALARCGEPLAAPALLAELTPSAEGSVLRSVIVAVDRFGNCVTGVRRRDVSGPAPAGLRWEGGATRSAVRTYAEIGGGLAVLWNSADHLELAAFTRPAAELAGLSAGAPVEVELG